MGECYPKQDREVREAWDDWLMAKQVGDEKAAQEALDAYMQALKAKHDTRPS